MVVKYKEKSRICTYRDFEQPWFKEALDMVKIKRIIPHRKLWEVASCIDFLKEAGMLKPGKKGLVFGCGQEKMPSLFASMGVEITATDYIDGAFADNWSSTNQLCSSKEQLHHQHIVSKEIFDEKIEFISVDMNNIPEDLHGKFDFVWSICALEHLGGLKQGADFILNSIECLKKDGVFFHTTEFNILSNDNTIDRKNTCYFREKDIEEIAKRITKKGDYITPRSYNRGNHKIDNHISERKRKGEKYPLPHLKVSVNGHVVSCFCFTGKKK